MHVRNERPPLSSFTIVLTRFMTENEKGEGGGRFTLGIGEADSWMDYP